jgi:acyl-CoA reductase-like NAD-dependent aldehyde dehydrogenase
MTIPRDPGAAKADSARRYARERLGSIIVTSPIPHCLFVGFKLSGRRRKMGRKVLDSYTEAKSVYVNLS